MAATREITIPVRWADTSGAWREAVARAIDSIDYKARNLEGWEPDHPLDPDYLSREGHIMWMETRSTLHPTVEVVRVRFRQKPEPNDEDAPESPSTPSLPAQPGSA
jgi:hypothetical protein